MTKSNTAADRLWRAVYCFPYNFPLQTLPFSILLSFSQFTAAPRTASAESAVCKAAPVQAGTAAAGAAALTLVQL
jgi:hypothetical protein